MLFISVWPRSLESLAPGRDLTNIYRMKNEWRNKGMTKVDPNLALPCCDKSHCPSLQTWAGAGGICLPFLKRGQFFQKFRVSERHLKNHPLWNDGIRTPNEISTPNEVTDHQWLLTLFVERLTGNIIVDVQCWQHLNPMTCLNSLKNVTSLCASCRDI